MKLIDELDTELNIGDILLITSSRYISHNIGEIINWKKDIHLDNYIIVEFNVLYPKFAGSDVLPITSKPTMHIAAKYNEENNVYKLSGGLKLVKNDILGRLLIRKLNK